MHNSMWLLSNWVQSHVDAMLCGCSPCGYDPVWVQSHVVAVQYECLPSGCDIIRCNTLWPNPVGCNAVEWNPVWCNPIWLCIHWVQSSVGAFPLFAILCGSQSSLAVIPCGCNPVLVQSPWVQSHVSGVPMGAFPFDCNSAGCKPMRCTAAVQSQVGAIPMKSIWIAHYFCSFFYAQIIV